MREDGLADGDGESSKEKEARGVPGMNTQHKKAKKQNKKTKKNAQERDPHEILQKRRDLQKKKNSHACIRKRRKNNNATHQLFMPQPILQQRIPHRPRSKKHHRRSEPNLKTVQVEPVDAELEPEEDVVEDGDRDRGGDAVVGEHVWLGQGGGKRECAKRVCFRYQRKSTYRTTWRSCNATVHETT